MISNLAFIWNLIPEPAQDKIKEISVNKATDFLTSVFTDANTLELIFWKAFEKVTLALVINHENAILKYRLEKGMGHPALKDAILSMNANEPLTEISSSFENKVYWEKIITQALSTLQTTEWRLEADEKTMMNTLLISQYDVFKNILLELLSEKMENSAKILLKTTFKTQNELKRLHVVIAELAQKMIGQVQRVNIVGNNNLILIDVKGKEIMISLQTFLDNYGALFQQVLYLLEDNKTTPYINLAYPKTAISA